MKRSVLLNGTSVGLLVSVLALAGCGDSEDGAAAARRSGLVFVDYRSADKTGPDGVAVVDLDPESDAFGEILQKKDIGPGVLPHHLYFNRPQNRLYTTALEGARVYEIILTRDKAGTPTITDVEALDAGDNIVAENMYFTEDGSRFYVTFMGGQGAERDGSVGVFNAQTNALIKTISAPEPSEPSSTDPFILWPHGISADEELGILMVTSTLRPSDLAVPGNTVTAIDMNTDTPVKTHLVAESPEDGSATVEVLLLRDDLPKYALVTTVGGGDIWVAPYDETSQSYGTFVKKVDGSDLGLGAALEFYIHVDKSGEKELFVSFAAPGVVNVYALDSLPELPFKRSFDSDPGTHHMVFFETKSGREILAAQNNLLDLPDVNSGTIAVFDLATGERLKTLDLPTDQNLMPEAVESAFGRHANDYHH